jgi:hypothetical protein
LKSAQPSSSLRARSVVTLSKIAPLRVAYQNEQPASARHPRFESAAIIVEAANCVQGANRAASGGYQKRLIMFARILTLQRRFR